MTESKPYSNLNFKAIQLVSINGSAGSFTALLEWVGCIPQNSKKIWLITLHRKQHQNEHLTQLIQGHTHLPVKEIEDKEQMKPGHVYVCPPNYHLLIEPNFQAELDAGEPVHFCRPAIDVLLESLSRSAPEKTCGILLSGANKDGGRGFQALHKKGGICLIQDPAYAEYPMMPQSAVDLKACDITFSNGDIPLLIQKIHEI